MPVQSLGINRTVLSSYSKKNWDPTQPQSLHYETVVSISKIILEQFHENVSTHSMTCTSQRIKKSTNNASSIDIPADLVEAGPSWLWTYQERVQRTWCRSRAPCWGGGMASVWCIYCLATDTSEDPGNEKLPLQHSKGQNYWFILLLFFTTEAGYHYNYDINPSPRQAEKSITCLTSCTDRRSRMM